MKEKRDKARIIGWGAYVPEKILSNADLEKMVETSDEWIVSRTGIQERRIAREDEFTSDMGAAAAKEALANAGLTATEIDLILVATMTPDYSSNNTAALIQRMLGAKQAAAVDVQAACSGFIYALSVAKAYIESGMYRRILLVTAEKMSSIVDYTDRATCVLFGDGAASVVVSDEGKGLAIEHVVLGADGDLAELLFVPAGGARQPATEASVTAKQHYIKMSGNEVFKHAVRRMCTAAEETLSKAGLCMDQITWLIPHQANTRIIDAVAKAGSIPDEKVYKTVHRYGNTSASSIPLAIYHLLKEQPSKPGDHLLLVAFGAGLTWGASLLKYV